MISEAIRILQEELADYLVANQSADDAITTQDIVLDNIAELEFEEGSDLANKVVLSLVNLQEEATLKNLPNYRQNPATGGYDYDRPPAYINLYILISCSPEPNKTDSYTLALDRLALVIEYFQAKNYFTISNSINTSIAQRLQNLPPVGIKGTADALRLEEIKMYVDLYSLTFEQLNHLWGSLGGKQVPSVLYKVRLVKLHTTADVQAPVIEEIASDSSSNRSN